MYKNFFKRILDFLLALFGFIILFPLLIPISILLRLTGEGEIFYLQKRVGYKNRYFKIWKFATMLKNSPNIGTGSLTIRNDPRLIPMGRFLRKTKINEVPQILNILKGEMSFVGPRPQPEGDFLKFPVDVQERICNIRPGLTGIASIVFRDEEKLISQAVGDKHEFYKMYIAPYKGKLEDWYQQHLSFSTDFLLILLTIWTVMAPNNDLIFRLIKDLPEKPEQLLLN